MPSSVRKPPLTPATAWGLLVLGAMLACYAGLYWSPLQVGSADPDRYYHLALARLASVSGLLRALPQVEDLGWGRYFPDKEFLFHLLTTLGYRAGGETGVLAVIPLLGTAIALTLYASLARVLPPWKAAVMTLLPLAASSRFLFRLMLLRPHVLAILCFCVLLWAVLGRRRLLACAAVFAFVLAYHAFYVPLIVIALSWPLRRTAANPEGLRLSWMVLALSAGLLLNPYFPSNLIMALTHAWIAIGVGMPADMQPGIEVMSLSVAQNFALDGAISLAPLGLAILLACYALGIYRGGSERSNYRFLLALTLVFAALALKTARATEYSIPCMMLLAGYALRHFSSTRALLAAGALFIAVQWSSSSTLIRNLGTAQVGYTKAAYLSAMTLFPDEAKGKKVFNCEWDAAPYILYAQPTMRFVDILDPALLWIHDPAKYAVRQRLIAGRSPAPVTDLRQQFKADYVLCASAAMNAQLKALPADFDLIASADTKPALALFLVHQK